MHFSGDNREEAPLLLSPAGDRHVPMWQQLHGNRG
jgi:hypothetical protein